MYLAFDIGGTKMRIAISVDGISFDKSEVIETPDSYNEAIKAFSHIFDRLGKRGEIKLSAGGIAGVFDKEKKMILKSPNLPDWQEKPIREDLREIVGCEVFLENDADLAGLGEAVYGAGKGFPIVAYITIGTGIGGVRIVNQKIDVSSYGFEPGHQYIDLDGSIAGRTVDFEKLVSGPALEKRYRKKPDQIVDEKVWDEIANIVSFGLNNTIVFWSPDVLILGGGVLGSLPIDRVVGRLAEILTIFPELPEVKKAQLGEKSGLYGSLRFLELQYE